MADRAKKANVLKIIKNEEIPIVPEVKAVANNSKRSSIKNKVNTSEEVTISTVRLLSLLSEEEKLVVPVEKLVSNSIKSTPATKENNSDRVVSVTDENQSLTQEKVKKILPPIPLRTPEEWQSAISNYDKELRASFPQRIPAMVGTVAANLSQEGRPKLYPRQARRVSKHVIQKLSSDPSIVIPTWEVLIDNDLSIGKKAKQLQALGWELEIIPVKGFREICLLAQILTNGVD
jgi:hypothetical protein